MWIFQSRLIPEEIKTGETSMGNMLKDRVAVITGAGSGLGRAHALGMAAQGARIVVNDIGTSFDGKGASNNPADLVVNTIKQNGGIAVANYDSVATEDGARKIIKTAIDNFGRIDILVNNAGIIRGTFIWDLRPEDWDAMIKTHLYGTYYCTHEAAPIMKEQKYGRIINTSSHNGLGVAGGSAYSAAKEGITGFSRAIARDMASFGVTCNVIRPIAAWRGRQEIIQEFEEKRKEDVAVLVVYLASEAADHINGCIFEVFNGHVGIFEEPPPVKQILWKDGSFTPEELAIMLPQTLTKGRSREVLPDVLPFKLTMPKTDK
jgi:NAD(P)-dependent dehydrogenase (short-subunit alcohol dehydrogenase family)